VRQIAVSSSGGSSSSSSSQTCAVRGDGSLFCWGEADFGALGIGRYSSGAHPVQVAIEPVDRVTLGGDHSCAVLADRTLWCWGSNEYGQLGHDPNADSEQCAFAVPCQTKPAFVSSTGDVDEVSLGGAHTCVRTGSTVSCFGDNSRGALGDGTTTGRSSPVAVPDISATHVVAGGHFTCAIVGGGAVACWGDNELGQLGHDFTGDPNCGGQLGGPCAKVPSTVSGLAGVTQLALGTNHACALLSDRSVSCWGRNEVGELGHDPSLDHCPPPQGAACSIAPVRVPNLSGVTQIALGTYHSCALLHDGTVKCWGMNYWGNLGIGSTDSNVHSTPQTVAGLSGVQQIGAGDRHTCALLDDGTMRCWGDGFEGQLGDGQPTGQTISAVPSPVTVLAP
jgi:alpha-tubulin suppressor-like RCC1 family protein